jgi:hypothetical protein
VPQAILAGVHDDAIEPSIEAIGVLKSSPIRPSTDRCVMDGVFSFLSSD